MVTKSTKRLLVTRPLQVLLLLPSSMSCHSGASGGTGPNATAPPSTDPTPPALHSARATAQDAAAANTSVVSLPGASGGLGFDDLVFASRIRRILAPAAASGILDLVDPDTMQVTPIAGFSSSRGTFRGGHGEGTTSADEGRGLLFAIDRTSGELDAVDPGAKAIVGRAKLAGSPDYVRWVEPTGEVWVTEPDSERVEVFSIATGPKPNLVHSTNIPVKGGPESLVIDTTRKLAFTHLWRGSSVVIDIAKHAPIATWPNGCGGSRGIAIDAKRGFLFAGCAEGRLVVMDVDHDGNELGEVSAGSGVDVIAYSPTLSHAYLPGAGSATMAFVGVAANGQLTVLGTVPTARGAHCVTADDRANAWVCDPDRGQLLVFKDSYGPGGS